MISEKWKMLLKEELGQKQVQALMHYIDEEYEKHTLYPPKNKVFRVFETAPEDVKCVILGQDPYHQPNQAMGLSFSVMQDIPVPKSLQNIYKEIQAEYGYPVSKSGDLSCWARQGVFLLNSSLCVEDSKPGSYMDAWRPFTDAVIRILDKQSHPIVFMLWGNFSIKKKELIKNPSHLVLTSPHPSPLSASRGFFGCNHFTDCNLFLTKNGIEPIDWRVM